MISFIKQKIKKTKIFEISIGNPSNEPIPRNLSYTKNFSFLNFLLYETDQHYTYLESFFRDASFDMSQGGLQTIVPFPHAHPLKSRSCAQKLFICSFVPDPPKTRSKVAH